MNTPLLVAPARFCVQPIDCTYSSGRAEQPWNSFLWRLFRACRDDEMQSVGMPPFPEALVRVQFEAKQRSQQSNYSAVERNVVLLPPESDAGEEKGEKPGEPEAVPVGAFVVHRPASGPLRLVDIAFLPAFRGRGLGTAIICGLQTEARARAVPLTLSVAADNIAARRLYDRLGFRPANPLAKETPSDFYLHLVWPYQGAV